MTFEERLRKHLKATVGYEDDWELEHLMLCDVCELDGGYDGVEFNRCDVAQAHEEMRCELYRREHPIPLRQSFGGITLTSASKVLEEMYLPHVRAQVEMDVQAWLAFGGGK